MELFKLVGKIIVDGVDDAAKDLEGFSAKAAAVGDKLISAGQNITNVGKNMLPVTLAIGGIGTAIVKTSADFESGMSKVAAISGATGDELLALSEKAKEMGAKTKFSATESSEALQYMAMAGWKTEEMLGGLEGIMNLAAASGEDLATTSDIVTDALTAFGLSASDSTHFADVLATASSNANTNVAMMGETFKYVAPVAGALGFSAEDCATAIGLMANAGIKSTQAGTALRSMFSRLAAPPDECATAMDKLNLSLTNSDGSMKSLDEVMVDLRKGFDGLSEAESAEIAKNLAGQEAMSGLLAIVNASDSDFEKLSSAISNCDGSAESMAETMNDNLTGQITLLKSQLEGVCIQLGEILVPIVKDVVERISEWVTWFSKLSKEHQKQIVAIALVVASIAPLLIAIGKVTTGVGSVIKIISVLSPAIAGISAPILAVVAVVGVLIAAFVHLWNTNEEFRNKVTEIWEQVKTTFDNFIQGIVDLLNDLGFEFNDISEVIQTVWQGLCDFLAPVFTYAFQLIADTFEFVSQAILSSLKFWISLFKGDWSGCWDAIKSMFSAAWDFIKNTFVNVLSTVNDLTGGKLSELWNKFKEKIDKIKDTVKTGLDKITGFFKNLKWELPKIKLPHFKIDGEFSLNPPSAPHFDIEWYAKAMNEPYMFTEPTIMGNKGFGEAGDEIVYGRKNLMDDIRNASDTTGIQDKMNDILDKLDELLNTKIYLNNDVMVGQLAPAMDTALGNIYEAKGRGGRSTW